LKLLQLGNVKIKFISSNRKTLLSIPNSPFSNLALGFLFSSRKKLVFGNGMKIEDRWDIFWQI